MKKDYNFYVFFSSRVSAVTTLNGANVCFFGVDKLSAILYHTFVGSVYYSTQKIEIAATTSIFLNMLLASKTTTRRRFYQAIKVYHV